MIFSISKIINASSWKKANEEIMYRDKVILFHSFFINCEIERSNSAIHFNFICFSYTYLVAYRENIVRSRSWEILLSTAPRGIL